MEAVNASRALLDFDGVEPALGRRMLSLWWARQAHVAYIVYRPVFMRDMACAGPYFSKLLLNAMFYSVSKHVSDASIRVDRADAATAGQPFRQRFVELLNQTYDKSHVTTIQALLIMASSLFTRCDERSTSWLYAGLAINMVADLGLHVEQSLKAPGHRNTMELEAERRVFWGAYGKAHVVHLVVVIDSQYSD
jgi:hypothetical protein